MNDFLLSYLDSIDERLLEYLDEDEELSVDAVRRLRLYTVALFAGSLTPARLAEDWFDWFHLAPAFVAAYGTEEFQQLRMLRCSSVPSKSRTTWCSPRPTGTT